MAAPKLYQRLKTAGYPWQIVTEFHKNGNPKISPDAYQLGVRYSIGGEQRMDRFEIGSLPDALLRLKQAGVEVLAAKNGVKVEGQGQTPTASRTPVSEAVKRYFDNLEAMGKDPKSIRTYRYAVDGFVASYKKAFIEDYEPQDMINFMGWLRKQPTKKRKHSNPERTYFNKCSHVAIFLKASGVKPGLKKNQYPRYHEKQVVAHTDDELALLYGAANAEDTFLLDYFIGSMVRDHEAQKCRYSDLTGTTLTVHGKQHKTRTVEISPRLADAIRLRGKHSESEILFPNGGGRPNQHLLRDLQDLAERAGAKFHTELHKMRKTGASRRYLAGVGLPTLMHELGHESLAVTQRYLADVKPEETKKAVADADFVPQPKAVAA